jgi:hypothetical protein
MRLIIIKLTALDNSIFLSTINQKTKPKKYKKREKKKNTQEFISIVHKDLMLSIKFFLTTRYFISNCDVEAHKADKKPKRK